MAARSEDWEDGRASRLEMVNRFLSSSPLKASSHGDRHVGAVSDQRNKICLPDLSLDSLDFATGDNCSVRRWPSLAKCCCCSLRVHSSSDASKQLEVIYLHMWKRVSDAGSVPHFYALLAEDLGGARCRGDKADGLDQDAVLFLVRCFAATMVVARGLEAMGSYNQRNMFEANFASFQRSESVYASKQLMFAVLFIIQSYTVTAEAAILEMLWFLCCAFDEISEADFNRKNISKCWALASLQYRYWWRPRACRSVSPSSSFELHFYLSSCGALYPLQATVHEYMFLPFGIRRRRVRAALLRILRFNGQDPPGLSSVMVHLDLQLIPLPQRHLPTRLLVEPLALRLAGLQEALEECNCRCFESEFSPDPLAGSNCTLLFRPVSSLAYLACVQLGNSASRGEVCNDSNVICPSM